MRTPARLAAAVVLGLAATGCLIGSETHTQQEGRRISQETLDRIRPGNSEEYVRALLGEPSSRTPVEGGLQVWKWQYRTVKRTEGAVFLLVSSDQKVEEAGAVFVEFENGLVTRTWRD
jgi:outer membrane protein assembly factor BamE (lipoprotein component of BamABCDE complex)